MLKDANAALTMRNWMKRIVSFFVGRLGDLEGGQPWVPVNIRVTSTEIDQC